MKNKKIFLLIMCTVFAASSAFGQDMIVKRNAEEIEAKVEEVTDTHIKYRRFSNSTGPVYNIAKNEVLMIRYENGEKDVFTDTTASTTDTSQNATAETLAGYGKMTANGRGFFIDGKRISVVEAKDYAMQYPEAIKHIRTGQGVYVVALVMAIGGGGLLGWQLGSALSGKKINTGGLVAGVLVTGGAFALTSVTVGQYKKAAKAYNAANGLAELPRRDVTLALASTHGGLGLQLTF